MVVTPCPWCGSTAPRPASILGGDFAWDRCADCGVIIVRRVEVPPWAKLSTLTVRELIRWLFGRRKGAKL